MFPQKKEPVVALDKKQALEALGEMEDELTSTKGDAESFLGDINEMSPDDMDFDLKDESLSPEDKDTIKKIKTPEDAKKALDTANKDIASVIDALDGFTGQATEEKEAIAFKRMNAKYSSSLINLAKQTDTVIIDAKAALAHWSFLKKVKRPSKKASKNTHASTNDPIDEAFSTVEKSLTFVEKIASALGYKKVEATAVPPTGADFSGDKWPNGKDPKEIEERAWHSGGEKFNRDKSFENARPNPSVDRRLDSSEYPRNDKPYVNASFKVNPDNKFSSYWEITDAKSGRKLVADFANVPGDTGPKNDQTFKEFASKHYGKKIAETVVTSGLETVQKQLGGTISKVTKEGLKVVAADKGGLKSYYTDAFGDSSYASELTSGAGVTKMDTKYTPKDDSVKSKKVETKDGPGKLSAKDIDIERAQARQAVILARKYASRGAIPFTKEAIFSKAGNLMKLTADAFKTRSESLDDIPIVNEAALKQAHIPDAETGIVGNTKEAVRDQNAKVNTEDIDGNVKGDANVKKSSFVPQTAVEGTPQIKYQFNTVKSRLGNKGITSEKLRLPKRT